MYKTELIKRTIESKEFDNLKKACIIEGAFGRICVVNEESSGNLITQINRLKTMQRPMKVNVLNYVNINGKNYPYEVEQVYIMTDSVYLVKDVKGFKGVNEELKGTIEAIENYEDIAIL